MIDTPTRRAVIGAGVFAAGSLLTIDAGVAEAPLALTPACHGGDAATLAQTEGPYFKPSSPERIELVEAGMAGQPIELTGFILTRACKPLAGALLDFWQADDQGRYDNSGFRLRGHQFSDAEGRYRLRSIVPGAYVGRTRHIHVKVQPRGGRVLTTQLYFPGESLNRTDGLFRRELGGVDSKDSLLGANQIQDFFWGGSLGCDGAVGFERRGVGTDGAADHRPT